MREGTSERDQGGDVVVITGAASGIGEALAIALSREWAIVGCDLPQRLAGLQKTASEHGFRAVAADITSPVDVERLFGTAVQEGVLRGVVNCAGVGQRAYLSETTPESFDRLVDVNLKGTFLVMREAFLTLRRHRAPGSIVAVSSINAAAVFPSQAVYSAAKAGVNSLVAAAAVEGGPYGRHEPPCR
jgi:NAD(P)-dependent dehydrogenase (short-subunit alcohol dehydrogenase family)